MRARRELWPASRRACIAIEPLRPVEGTITIACSCCRTACSPLRSPCWRWSCACPTAGTAACTGCPARWAGRCSAICSASDWSGLLVHASAAVCAAGAGRPRHTLLNLLLLGLIGLTPFVAKIVAEAGPQRALPLPRGACKRLRQPDVDPPLGAAPSILAPAEIVSPGRDELLYQAAVALGLGGRTWAIVNQRAVGASAARDRRGAGCGAAACPAQQPHTSSVSRP